MKIRFHAGDRDREHAVSRERREQGAGRGGGRADAAHQPASLLEQARAGGVVHHAAQPVCQHGQPGPHPTLFMKPSTSEPYNPQLLNPGP